MVRLIGEAGAELAGLPEDERPGTVLEAILTDGHENSSREANGAMVKAAAYTAEERRAAGGQGPA